VPSEKVLQQKQQVVEELKTRIANAKSFVIANYRGLTVEQDTELRNALREAGVEYSVVKNTLTKFAAKANGYDGLEEYLTGPTAIAFSNDDAIAPAKVLAKFEKQFEKLTIKGGVVDGAIIDASSVQELAKLPSKEELVAKILAGFNAPISGFANVLNANIRGLVVALNAVAEQKAS
jgi:large subunit ribosomal protein L10